jgi:glycosyltransferase involved in cell wall biosynthesis
VVAAVVREARPVQPARVDAIAESRPRLLFLGHGAERTGPPILLGHLLAGLGATGRYDLTVLVARSGPLLAPYAAAPARTLAVGTGREPLASASSALRRLGASVAVGPLQDLARRRAARRAGSSDLVYVNAATPPTAALLRAMALPRSTPVILHVHELDVGLRRTLDEADRRMLFDRADHLIAASGAVERLLIAGHGIAPERITTCPEFVDVAALAPLARDAARAELDVPSDAAVVGCIALPDWRKDPDHLLRAVHRLRGLHPDLDPWVVWIGGDPAGADGQRVLDEAARLGLERRLRHVSHQDRPDRLLAALDVFALPAREDALPLAALEAAATGRPLVCFRTGGVADLCDLGAGLAVAYPDTDAFAAALGDLLSDPDRRAATGAKAAELVRTEHDAGVGVDRIVEVIEAVRRGGPP